MADFIELNPNNIDEDGLSLAVDCFKSGGVVVYPTDTIYALGCSLLQPKGIEKLARIKGIRIDKAVFSLVFHDFASIADYTRPMSTSVYKLMKRCLPGPFTFILESNANVTRLLSSRRKTIGVRIPDNAVTLKILENLGCPIVSSSLHDEDEIVKFPTDPNEIFNQYENMVDMVIDGGYGHNEESTIIDCTAEEPVILRQGAGIV